MLLDTGASWSVDDNFDRVVLRFANTGTGGSKQMCCANALNRNHIARNTVVGQHGCHERCAAHRQVLIKDHHLTKVASEKSCTLVLLLAASRVPVPKSKSP